MARHGRHAGTARVRTSDRGRQGGTCRTSRGCLCAAISVGLLQALILSLPIADSLGQHLAQLSLCFAGFARRPPLGYERYGNAEESIKPPREVHFCFEAITAIAEVVFAFRDTKPTLGECARVASRAAVLPRFLDEKETVGSMAAISIAKNLVS
jgi:hypothetical protein